MGVWTLYWEIEAVACGRVVWCRGAEEAGVIISTLKYFYYISCLPSRWVMLYLTDGHTDVLLRGMEKRLVSRGQEGRVVSLGEEEACRE